ncbi:MAG: histidinol dehydrogenase [Planctomycetota bacterium]|nr:histidinol dehydrogenase [Planctomycetota bacterium]
MSARTTPPLLRRVAPDEVRGAGGREIPAEILEEAARLVDDVATGGAARLRFHAERLGDVEPGGALVFERAELVRALESLPGDQRGVLERAAERIRAFAEAQRGALRPLRVEIPGGEAGHDIVPMESAGCYVPGGRFPLPSSALMTVITARAAGVRNVWAASPRPRPVTLAAAGLAGADGLLAAGGAHGVAALAFGAGVLPGSDIVVGPGNAWVTAAKRAIMGRRSIDMLAGPSELLVLADDSADPETIAADLLAQAEHDSDASPMLVSLSAGLCERVEAALSRRLPELPAGTAAGAALANGFACVCGTMEEAIAVCDRAAPEHLQVMTRDAERVAARLGHCGAVFIGTAAAEVVGDYGAGPNHTLPTAGAARRHGGLSVFNFLRVRTWMRIDDAAAARGLYEDAAAFARMEGLEAHARAAERRLV